MSTSPTRQEYTQTAQTILENLLRLLEFTDTQIEVEEISDQLEFRVVTAEAGRLIGRTAQTLDAVQFLLNRLLSRRYDDGPYCLVDTEQYRARRREKLLDDADKALEHVRGTGQSYRMGLLHSMDRRLIHQYLKDCPDIQTYSEDADGSGRKRLVIALTDTPPSADDDEPPYDDDFEAEAPEQAEADEAAPRFPAEDPQAIEPEDSQPGPGNSLPE
ncbi:MAG: KH domain-containing protein [Lentisphaerae bacterium]|jgi:spoIIIJ-associated protein|nr:KH domain-containing protein [Lentisphaerota bacterium]